MEQTLRVVGLIGAIQFFATATAIEIDTGTTGSGDAFSNLQPSVVVNYSVSRTGLFPSTGGSGSTPEYPLGFVRSTAANFPLGGTAADGRSLLISDNTALYSLFGTNFGGDGRVRFELPDLRGAAPRHVGGSTRSLGRIDGESMTTLDVSQMPSHEHGIPGIAKSTSSVGGTATFSNLQPSQGLNYLINTTGNFVGPSSGSAPGPFLGQIALFGGNFAPSGWAFANGQDLNISDLPNLFSVLGTTYGGDGRTTFGLPDLRDRIVVGANSTDWRVGTIMGEADVLLTEPQLPDHLHTLTAPFDATATEAAGGSALISNIQPSIALNYIIATSGIFPTPETMTGETTLGEISLFAGTYAPRGWMFADGSLLDISDHSALFALLGINFGGDGRTQFRLPDLRGRAAIGAGLGADGVFYDIGDLVGTSNILLDEANLPPHFHTAPVPIPASLPLLGAALGLLATIRRRPTRTHRSLSR